MTDTTKHSPLDHPLLFEPHSLAGELIEGEVMPFGYISLNPKGPVPIFELSTLLEFQDIDLNDVAAHIVKCVNEAPELHRRIADLENEIAALNEINEGQA